MRSRARAKSDARAARPSPATPLRSHADSPPTLELPAPAAHALFGLLVAAALVAWGVFAAYTRIRLEDALVTFRYAENLALGHGFVYNPGERVLGTTTPLFALLLSVAGRLFGTERIPAAATAIGFAAMIGAAFFTRRALERLGAPRLFALVGAALLLFHPDTLWMVCGGMETPLVLLFMAASLDFASRDRWKLAAAAAALLVFTRVDGALWALLLLTAGIVRTPRAVPGALALATALLVPWLVFASVYFGSPLPHAVIAKIVVGQSHGEPARYLHWFEAAIGVPPGAGPYGATFWMWNALLLLGARLAARKRRLLLGLVAFAPLFCLALWIGRAPRSFPWYLSPVTWACVVIAATGAEAVTRAAARVGGQRLSSGALLVALGAIGVQDWSGSLATARIQRDWQHNETGLRRAVGEWLAAETPPGALVAMEAIGYQGVYSRRRVYDLGGILSPEAVRIARASRTNADVFATTLEKMRPGYLVLRSFEVDRNRSFHGGPLFDTREQFEAFTERYVEARRFAAPVPGLWGPMSYLTVYRRRADPGP